MSVKAKIVITQDGQVGIFTQDGTFLNGKEAIEKFFAKLQVAGVKFSEVGEVEQHRHDNEAAYQYALHT